MINIAIALDENYAPHTAALIASIYGNTVSKDVDIYLLTDNLTDDTKSKLKQVGKKISGNVYIIEGNIENFYTSAHLSKAAYLRLKIPHLLPSEVGRVVYLDADLLVKSDISELFDMDLFGKPVAAVPDLGIMTSKRSMKEKAASLGLKPKDLYFNSGVLVIDVEQWRKNDYANKLLELVKSNNFRHHDQDALNMLFYNEWRILPLEFNVIPPVFELPFKVLFSKYARDAAKAIRNAKIIHFAGGHKPWHYRKTKDLNEYYYEMLALTPFDEREINENVFRKYRERLRILRGKVLSSVLS